MKFTEPVNPVGRVAELFAGVGGFRLGLAAAGWETVFSNQWEPSTKRQHASEVYVHNFGPNGHSNDDISSVSKIPTDFDLLVGGFPCQDYSVAKTKSSAAGLSGKKGVLWWEILRLVSLHRPKFIFLENVDRLLKSPSTQRGRDFAVMLSSLGSEGYSIEWRVVNAADYGFAQRRRRVFIVATREQLTSSQEYLAAGGVLAEALPFEIIGSPTSGKISEDLFEVSSEFGMRVKKSPFLSAGVFSDGKFVTASASAIFEGASTYIRDILLPNEQIPQEFFINNESLAKWKHLKGAKSEKRVHSSGFEWNYTEGSMKFPDSIDGPSRTILTAEGGSTPSRFKHAIDEGHGLRRLVPVELERLNGFPDDWTRTGTEGEMPDGKRAFFMGNALVVGLVKAVGSSLAQRL